MTLPRPQRLTPPSPLGSLLKRTGVPTRSRIPSEERNPDYLALVRQCPCLRCGQDPAGVAAHLRLNSGLHNKRQALGRKPADSWVTPLCTGCHTNDADAQHRVGELVFWDRIGINPFLACERLHARRGDLVAMRAVVFSIIAERCT
jgi:hypothetical protein